jgi:DeoR family transcriptional regulator of aga operon
MNQATRLRYILDRLSEQDSIDVEDLVGTLGVSAATVRRDLEKLHDQRLLERRHGGAVALSGLYELPLRYRGSLRSEEKLRIARAAIEHVHNGTTVALTGGTTTTEVSRMLTLRNDVTVVTNAINIAAELAVRPNVRLIMSGGVARAASYELTGPLAEDVLGQLNVEIIFLGVDGITAAAGTTTHDEVEARTNRVMAERAAQVIVVADGTKVGKTALARICEIGTVNILITSHGADPSELALLKAAGVRVQTV